MHKVNEAALPVHQLLDPWTPRGTYEVRRTAVYQFHAAVAQQWRRGRVFLGGDAAHQTPPFRGHSFRFFGHVHPEEGEPVQTPTPDSLAAQSTVFDQTYCQVALCTPSRICMLTSQTPMENGGWFNESVLKPGNPTLPQTLAEAGYTTALITTPWRDG